MPWRSVGTFACTASGLASALFPPPGSESDCVCVCVGRGRRKNEQSLAVIAYNINGQDLVKKEEQSAHLLFLIFSFQLILIDLLSKEQCKSNQLCGKVHLFGRVFERLPRQKEEGVWVDEQWDRIAEIHVLQPEISHLSRFERKKKRKKENWREMKDLLTVCQLVPVLMYLCYSTVH